MLQLSVLMFNQCDSIIVMEASNWTRCKLKKKKKKRPFWVKKQRMRKSAVEILHSPINSQSASPPTTTHPQLWQQHFAKFYCQRGVKKKERKSSFSSLLAARLYNLWSNTCNRS